MAERKEFLDRIRQRTKRYRPTQAPDVAWTRKGKPPESALIENPSARFIEELGAVNGHGRQVEGLEGARDYILALAQERGAKLMVRWDVEELERLDVDGPLAEAGVEVAVWRDLENFHEVAGRADIGLSTAEWAVAETGSVVITSGPGKGRTVTLLPPVHVAAVPADRILPNVADAIRLYAEHGRLPANISFHTGPSRSGDIEQSLTIGVHGPAEMHVLLVE